MNAKDHYHLRNPLILDWRQRCLWPHRSTVYRWTQRRQNEGHFCPYRRTGNARATVLRGLEEVQLAWLMCCYPRINAAETNTFLYHVNGQRRFYHPSQIYRAQQRIGLSKKRASTTAMQAALPINQQRRWSYWNLPYPFGIADIVTDDLIDIDEAAVFEESANRSSGKCHLSVRCRDDGIYGHSTKTNVLLAISGEHATPHRDASRWLDMWEDGGTTTTRFVAFIQRIIRHIGQGTAHRRRCFIMDNLNSHRNLLVQQLILQAGHRVVFRAPYHPVDGPIEYYFNRIQNGLTLAMYWIDGKASVKEEVRTILRNTSEFRPYFIHCKHSDN